MPELPEVETIRLGLKDMVVGQTIKEISVDWSKSFAAERAQIDNEVIGKKITDLERRAKILIMDLANGMSLMFHLKMTGQLVLLKAKGERFAGGHPTESMLHDLPDRSTRVVFEFDSGDTLFFNDQRKFGWIKLVPTDEIDLDPLVKRLGPEPFSPEFTPEGLAAVLKRRAKSPVKPIILDQSTVSGVGNIYADEALHSAKIHPKRLAGSIKPAEVKCLHQAIISVMKDSIQHGGTSFSHYVNAFRGKGDYLDNARVFRKEGQLCMECGTMIEKIRVAGRGTHLCPNCQKLK